ncbi:hypothetical protein [Aquimarina sp. RZ0]|uniref:hypothetical protein n=1 Tax=Aquimarina sp. RZ0 TaxID=2607730 RepID=UPI0011F0F339|nr:hypothetical protein [Aquimarina sp. RZ0]KAA1240340.1 hypothetical protein F0000_27105 [Aquimarina sp. RZ0]
MTFREIEHKEGQGYFVNYEKVWQTIEKFNWTQEVEDKIKGATIDTLICTLNLYEEYINSRPPVIDEDFRKRRLTIDAFRIGKLAGYGTSTIKKHLQKLKELDVLHIEVPMPEYAKGYYHIHLNSSYIFIAEPMGLILTK